MSSLRPSVSLLALAARRAASLRPTAGPASIAGPSQRRFLPSSSSLSGSSPASSQTGSHSGGSQQKDKANPNKHKQWYRELVPAALPALAIGLGVYMVRPACCSSLRLSRLLFAGQAPLTKYLRSVPSHLAVLLCHPIQALHLLRLNLSAERELLTLNNQVASLEAELADLQERHGRSVSSTLREMFSKAAGGQGVVDALTNDANSAIDMDADATAITTAEAALDHQPNRSWWSWGRS